MKVNPKEIKSNSLNRGVWAGLSTYTQYNNINILVISANEVLHNTIVNTLENFSLNGRELFIYRVANLSEARIALKKMPETLLILIDDNVQVNGSYQNFIDYVRKDLKNNTCAIETRSNLMSSFVNERLYGIHKKGSTDYKPESIKYKIIDVIRMILLTNNLEESSINQAQKEIKKDNNLDINIARSETNNNITREKLYTILAHDLKSPASKIKVMVDFLTNEQELIDEKTSRELLSYMQESANSMHEMLDNFSFWTRMHKHEIDFNPVKVKLANLIRENITLLKSVTNNKKIKVSTNVDENTFVFGDEYMICTVLRNLLYNAVKFTKSGGAIEFLVYNHLEFVEIQVIDNGIGFAKKEIERIFHPDAYFTTKGTAKESGIGLGLILCKDFVENNGGIFKLSSIEGKGSTFSFTLPVWDENN